MNSESVFSNTKVGLKIVLYRNKVNKQGKSPIMLRITANYKQKYVSTKIQIEEKWWDAKNSKVKSSHPNSDEYNAAITLAYAQAEKTYMELYKESNSDEITVQAKVRTKINPTTVVDVLRAEEIFLNNQKRFGTATRLKDVISTIPEHLQKVRFEKLSKEWIDEYVDYITTKLNYTIKGNGVGSNLRSLKSVFRKANPDNDHIVSKFFKGQKLTVSRTRKRAIDVTLIKKIMNLNLETPVKSGSYGRGMGQLQFEAEFKALRISRDLFMLSLMCSGVNFKDLALLKKKDVKNGRIEFTRAKTGSIHSILITQPVKDLLENLFCEGPMLLPIVIDKKYWSDLINTKQFNEYYKQRLRRHNKRLKHIGQQIGLDADLTTYVARHSFATLMNQSQVHISVIQQSLGHHDVKTTQTYLADLDLGVMDAASNKVGELLNI